MAIPDTPTTTGGWITDEYGQQVYQPIDPGGDPSTDWATTELGEVEDLFKPGDWETYGGYFDQYDPTSEFYEKEKLQRTGAGIDIGQLQGAWGLKSGQLTDVWGTETTGDWGELLRQKRAAGATWGLQKTELERQRLRLGEQINEATDLWGFQQGELRRGGTEAQTL